MVIVLYGIIISHISCKDTYWS